MSIFTVASGRLGEGGHKPCVDCGKVFHTGIVAGQRSRPSATAPVIRCVACARKVAERVNAHRRAIEQAQKGTQGKE